MKAITVACAVFAAGVATAGPDWTRNVNGYRLVHWSNSDADRQTLVLRNAHGRLVLRLTDVRVEARITKDLVGDGTPGIFISSWSGGADQYPEYYIYSLGALPRCLAACYQAMDEWRKVDLDHDGRYELLNNDDVTLRYFGDNGRGGGPVLPLVLKLRDGRYVDATAHFPQVLRKALDAGRKNLAERLAEVAKDGDKHGELAAAGECYAIACLLGRAEARSIWKEVSRRLRPEYLKTFREDRRLIESRMRYRPGRIEHLRSYGVVIDVLRGDRRSLRRYAHSSLP